MNNNQLFQFQPIKEENIFEVKLEVNDVDIESDNFVKQENFFSVKDCQTFPLIVTEEECLCKIKQEPKNVKIIDDIFKNVGDYPNKSQLQLPSVSIKEENIAEFKIEPNDFTTQTDIFFKQEEFNTNRDNFENNQYRNFNVPAIKIECDSKNKKVAKTIDVNYDSPSIKRKNLQSFECGTCSKKYVHKLRLSTHMKTHINPTTLACYVCKLKFSCLSSLYYHKKVTHSNYKPFVCDICKVKFAHKSHLSDHIRIHTGDKPFVCKVCGTKFSRNSLLTCHLRVHTGEKPYKCDICEKKFSQKTHLSSHRKLHSGEKTHKCDICMKKFACKSNLMKHLVTHQDKKPYKCNKCQLTFSYRASWTSHVNAASCEVGQSRKFRKFC